MRLSLRSVHLLSRSRTLLICFYFHCLQVIFLGSPWDVVSFQQGSNRCGRRSLMGQPVPGSVHIVQGSKGGPSKSSTDTVTDFQQRAGKDQMQTFVETLRLSAGPSNAASPPPPCFRQLQFGFLSKDTRTCDMYMDGTVLCSSCLSVRSESTALVNEFHADPPAWAAPPSHPSVVAARQDARRTETEARTRVSTDFCHERRFPLELTKVFFFLSRLSLGCPLSIM